MDLHDFGSVIWAIFIAIAIISSIVRSARKTGERIQQRVAKRPAPFAAPQQPSQAHAAPATPAPPAPARVAVVAAPARSSEAVRTVPLPMPRTTKDAAASARVRREEIFLSGDAVVRGIIALEVLGPPRALREWTSIV